MLIIVGLSLLTVIGIVILLSTPEYSVGNDAGSITSIGCGLFLFIALIVLIATRYDTTLEIESYKMKAETIAIQRENFESEYELAALTIEIAEMNGWLVAKQMAHQNTFTNWFIPNEIMDLELIR